MAIEKSINHKGIQLDKAYIKLKSIKLDIEIYANQEARDANQVLENKHEYIEVDEKGYDSLKELYPGATDLIEETIETSLGIQE